MREGVLGSLATLFTGTALALAQSPVDTHPQATTSTSGGPANVGQQMPLGNNGLNGQGVVHPSGNGAPVANGTVISNGNGAVTTQHPTIAGSAPMVIVEPAIPGVSIPDGPNAFGDGPPDLSKGLIPEVGGPGRIWFNAEYLYWMVKDGPAQAATITTGPAGSAGILGAPGTSVLFGQNNINYDGQHGGRFNFGFTDGNNNCAIEASYFWLATARTDFTAVSDAIGNPVLARPFINTLNNQPTSSLISSPGAFAGRVNVASSSDIWGSEANIVKNMGNAYGLGVDMILGFRYMRLEEDVFVSQTSNVLPGGVIGFLGESILAPATINVQDNFITQNDFYGGQVGATLDFHPHKWFFVTATGLVAFGNTHQTLETPGRTTLQQSGVVRSAPGGILAPAGALTVNRDDFTVIPELRLNMGVQLCSSVRAYVGYSFMYWDDVARPGNVSTAVNASQVPSSLSFGAGLGTPSQNQIQGSDFFAHGFNAGLALRY